MVAPAPSAGSTVTVGYTVGGTATAGTDFTALSGTVDVTSTGTADITVTIIDDAVGDADETIVLTLTDGEGYLTGTTAKTTITIADDEPVVSVAWTLPESSSLSGDLEPLPVLEGAAASFVVTADGPVASDLDVSLRVADAADADFVAAGDEGSKTVTIKAGASRAVYSVPTVDDMRHEPDGAVTVSLVAAQSYNVTENKTVTAARSGRDVAVTGASSASLTVHDDDPPIVVSLSGGGHAEEGDASSTASLTIELSQPRLAGDTHRVPLTVEGTSVVADDLEFAVVSGAGVSLEGATTLTPTVVFTGAGSDAAVLAVSAGEDADSIHENATVSLGTLSGALSADGAASSVRVRVVDDEGGAAVLTSASAVATAEGATTAYSIRLSAAPTGSNTVTVVPSSGNSNVATVAPASLVFSAANWDVPQAVTVTGVRDNVDNRSDISAPAGTRSTSISHAVNSTDPAYASASASAPGVAVSVVDRDPTTVSIRNTGRRTLTEGQSIDDGPANAVVTRDGVLIELSRSLRLDERIEVPIRVSGVNVTPADLDARIYWQVAVPNDEGIPANRIRDEANQGVTYQHAGTVIRPSADTSEWDWTPAGRERLPIRWHENQRVAVSELEFVAVFDAGEFDAPNRGSGEWPVPRTGLLVLSFADDDLAEGRFETVSVSLGDAASFAGRFGTSVAGGAIPHRTNNAVSIRVDDNEPGVWPSALEVELYEGTSTVTSPAGGYSLRLSGDPGNGATVKVAITSSDTSKLTVSPAEVAFTGGSSGNWETSQPLTLTAAADDTVDDELVTLRHTVSGWTGVTTAPDVAVRIDDSPAGATVSQSNGSTRVTETAGAGRTDTYTVVLESRPTHDVTVTPTPSSARVTVSGPLTFTPVNWQTAQTVTVTAVDDDLVNVAADLRVSIAHAAVSTDPRYQGFDIGSVTVTITDDDSVGLTLTRTGDGTVVTDDGSTDTYSIVLNSEPTDDVTVTVTSPMPAVVTVNAAGGAPGATAALTFTPQNWDTPQAVTVTGVRDEIDNSGRRTVTLTHLSASDDTNYNALTASEEVRVNDDDTTEVRVIQTGGTTRVTDNGSTDTYRVELSADPGAGVTVTVMATSADASVVTVNKHGGAAAATASLTFTGGPSGNWNRPQTITVTGVSDDLDNVGVDARDIRITHAVTASDNTNPYHGVTVAAVTVRVADNDPAVGFTVTETGSDTRVAEDGGTDTYTVKLNSKPTANVVVTARSSNQNTVRLSTGGASPAQTVTLTFTPNNWSTAQTVTVTGQNDDSDNSGDLRSATINHSVSTTDTRYRLSVPSVTVQVGDDDESALVITHSGGSTWVSEDSGVRLRDTYTVKLGARPSAAVQLKLTSDDTGLPLKVNESGSSISTVNHDTWTRNITPGQWDTAITFVVEGGDYTAQTGNSTWTISHELTSTDSAFNDTSADLEVLLIDDDAPAITVIESDGDTTASEGGTDTYEIVLSTDPARGTSQTRLQLTVASQDTARAKVSSGSRSKAAQQVLTFTAADWRTPQTVTVHGETDNVHNTKGDHSTTITTMVGTVPVGGDYVGMTVDPIDVTVTDADLPPSGVRLNATVTVRGQPIPVDTTTLKEGQLLDLVLTAEWIEDRPADIDTTIEARLGCCIVSPDTPLANLVAGPAYDPHRLVIFAGRSGSANSETINFSSVNNGGDQADATYELRPAVISGYGRQVPIPQDFRSESSLFRFLDVHPTLVSLSADKGSIAENGGTAEVTVELGAGLGSDMEVIVPLTFTGAELGGQYSLALKTGTDRYGVAFNRGVSLITSAPHSAQNPALRFATEDTAVLVVTAIGNRDTTQPTLTVAHGTGDRIATVTGSGGGITTSGGPLKLTITNDDLPVVSIAADPAITEGGSASFSLHAAPVPQQNLQVKLRVTHTGAAGSTTMTTNAVITPAGTVKYPRSTTDDEEDEVDGEVTVEVLSGSGYTVSGTGATATVPVRDDDPTTVSLEGSFQRGDPAQPVITWNEGEGGGTRRLSVTLGRRLAAGEVLEVPIVVDGVDVGTEVSLSLQGSPAGASLAGSLLTVEGPTDRTLFELDATFHHDADRLDESVVFSLPDAWPSETVPSAKTNLSGGAVGSGTSSIFIIDDDKVPVAGVVVDVERLKLREGQTGGYTVRLGADPGQGVTVTVSPTSRDSGAVRATPATLTFTGGSSGNWATGQRVSVTAAQDADSDHEHVVVVHSVSGYPGIATAPSVRVVGIDDEATASGLVIVPTELPANLFANAATQSVELVPLGVSFVGAGGQGGAGRNRGERLWQAVTGNLTDAALELLTVSGATGLKIDSGRLVRTSDSAGAVSHSAVLELSYSGAAITSDTTVTVTVPKALLSGADGEGECSGQTPEDCTDKSTLSDISATFVIAPVNPAVSVSPAALDLTEGGAAKTYSVVLATDPGQGATVVVTPRSADAGAVTVSGALIFTGGTAGTWSVPQQVTVTPVEDPDGEPETLSVTHAVTGYSGVTTAPSVSVTVADDETLSATVTQSGGSTRVVEAGAGNADTYTVQLDTRPTGDVTVTITSADPALAKVHTSGTAATTAELKFTQTTWSTPQMVTVTGVDDSVDNPGDGREVRLSHRFAGADYGSVTVPDVVAVLLDDDPTTVSLSGGGTIAAVDTTATASVTVTLSRALTDGEVIAVPLALSATGGVTVSGATNRDFDIALASGTTGAALSGATTATPVVTFTGAVGSTTTSAVLEFNAADGLSLAGNTVAKITVALGNRTAFDAQKATTAQGGGAPHATNNSVDVNARNRLVAPSVTLTALSVPEWLREQSGSTAQASRRQTLLPAEGTLDLAVRASTVLHGGEQIDVPIVAAGATFGADGGLTAQCTAAVTAACAKFTAAGGWTVTLLAGAPTVVVRVAAASDTDSVDESVTLSIPASSTTGTPKLTPTGIDAEVTGTGSVAFGIDDIDNQDEITVRLTGGGSIAGATDGDSTTIGVVLSRPLTDGEVLQVSLAADGTRVTNSAYSAAASGTGVTLAGREGAAGSADATINLAFTGADDATVQQATLTIDSTGADSGSQSGSSGGDGDQADGWVIVSVAPLTSSDHGTSVGLSLGHFDDGDRNTIHDTATAVRVRDDDAPSTPLRAMTWQVRGSQSASLAEGDTVKLVAGAIGFRGEPQFPLKVPLTYDHQSSSSAADFGVLPDSVFIPYGLTEASIDITALTDSVVESAETLRVTAGAPDGYRLTSPHVNLTVTDTVTVPVSVALSAPGGSIAEAGGTKDVTVTLGRTLTGLEVVTVPLSMQGATATEDFTLALEPSTQTGVTLVTSGTHSAQNPALELRAGASSAVLRLTAVANALRSEPEVFVSYGTSPRTPSASGGARISATTGSPLRFMITDDETGAVVLPVSSTLIPSGLEPGDEFRLLWLTSNRRTPEPSDISAYDSFVRQSVAQRGSQALWPYSGFVRTLVSVWNRDARDYTSTTFTAGDKGLPIYWFNGGRVATDYEDFYDGSWGNATAAGLRNDAGTSSFPGVMADSGIPFAFTGSNADGTRQSGATAGTANIRVAGHYQGSFSLSRGSTQTRGTSLPFIAMSPVFEVAAFEVSVADASAAEGSAVDFTVSLSSPATADVTVPYTLSDGRGDSSDPAYSVATGAADGTGADYTNAASSITISKGASTGTISVPTTDDNTHEGDHRFTVTLGTPTQSSGVVPTVSTTAGSALGTITDAADRPTVQFSSATASAPETAGKVAFTVTKTGATLTPATVEWSTADPDSGTAATAGQDYTAASGTLTFAANETSKTVEVVLLDDDVAESSETFAVELSSPAGAVLGTRDSAVATVLDADVEVALSAAAGDVAEKGGTKDVTVTLTGAYTGTFTVPLSVFGATVGTDFTLALQPPSQTGVSLVTNGAHSAQNPAVQFTSPATSAVLRFTAVDNARRSHPAVFIAFGTGARAPGGGGTTLGRLTGSPVGFAVTDDETGHLYLPGNSPLMPSGLDPGDEFRLLWVTSGARDAAATGIGDYDGFVRELVARSGVTELRPYTGLVSVLASTAAVDARDHTATTHTGSDTGAPIWWLTGSQAADDYADFYDGAWAAQAHSDARTEAGTNTGFTGSTVIWTGSGASGVEHSASGTSYGLGRAAVASASLSNLNGTSRTPLLTGTAANSGSGRFYALSPVFKAFDEVTLSVSSSGAVTEGGTLTVTATLTSNAQGPLTIPVQMRTSGSPTAAAADFSLSNSGNITIADGASSGTLTLTAVADSLEEADTETFTLELGALPTGYLPGTPSHVDITITDNDEVGTAITETGDTTSVAEAGGTDTYTVALTTQPTHPVTVTVASKDASVATVAPTTLTFSTTDWDDPQTVTVTGVPDPYDNPDDERTVVVAHSFSSTDASYNGLDDAEVQVTVTDDDATPSVSLIQLGDVKFVRELAPGETLGSTTQSLLGSGNTTIQVGVQLSADVGPGQTIEVPITASGAALAYRGAESNDGLDVACIAFGSECAKFNAEGGWVITLSQAHRTARFFVSAPEDDDEADEDVTLSIPASSTTGTPKLSAAGFGGEVTGSGSVSFRVDDIDNQDEITARLTGGGSVDGATDGDSAQFKIVLSRALVDGESVRVGIGRADFGSDGQYSIAVSGSGASVSGAALSDFDAGVLFTGSDDVVVQEATVTVSSEGDDSGTQTDATGGDGDLTDGWVIFSVSAVSGEGSDVHGTSFGLELTHYDDGDAATVDDVTTAVLIADDEAADRAVSWRAADGTALSSASVNEGESVTLAVRAVPASGDGTLKFPVRVPLSYDHQSSSSAADFEPLPGFVLIPYGQTEAEVDITALVDAADDNEKLRVTAANPDGYAFASPNVDLTVTDVAPPRVAFGSATYTGGEASASRTVTIPVTVTPAPSAGSTVTVAYTVAGTATSATDFTALSGSVDVGSTGTADITVTVLDDTADDDDETIVLTLSDRGAYDLGTPSVATVTITDDDSLTVTLTTLLDYGERVPWVREPPAGGRGIQAVIEGDGAIPVVVAVNSSLGEGETIAVPVAVSGASFAADGGLSAQCGPGDCSKFNAEGGWTVTLNDEHQAAHILLQAAADADKVDEVVTLSIPASSTTGSPKLAVTGISEEVTGSGELTFRVDDTGNQETITARLTGGGTIDRFADGDSTEFKVVLSRPLTDGEAVTVGLDRDTFGVDDSSVRVSVGGVGVSSGANITNNFSPVTFRGADDGTVQEAVVTVTSTAARSHLRRDGWFVIDVSPLTENRHEAAFGLEVGHYDDGDAATLDDTTTAVLLAGDNATDRAVSWQTADGTALSTVSLAEGETATLVVRAVPASGDGTLKFPVRVPLTYTHTSTSAADFEALPEFVFIPYGQTSAQIDIVAVIDAVTDDSEVLRVTAGNPDGYAFASPHVDLTVTDTTAQPSDAVFDAVPDDLTLTENADGSTTAVTVGSPVTATDVNDDTITYSLEAPSGTVIFFV